MTNESEDEITVVFSAIAVDANGLDKIEKLIGFTNEFLKLGAFVFPNVKAALGVVTLVGGFVKTMSAIGQKKKEDPIMVKLGELETKINSLASQMNSKFEDLKSFITEINFHESVIQPTSKLTRYMIDCLNHPGEESLKNFQEAYEKRKPLDLAYTLLGLMDHDLTNPLKMAMNTDLLKTKTTFEKWDKTIRSALGHFLFLEGYANGLIGDSSQFDAKRIIEGSEKLFAQIDSWREDYIKTDAYWQGMKPYLEKFVDENQNKSLSEKANLLKNVMETVLSSDAFYIVVMSGSAEWHKTYTYHCPRANTQMAGVWNRNGCCAFVYRSRQAKDKHPLEYKYMTRLVDICKNGKLNYTHSMENAPKSVVDNPIFDAGLICCINTVNQPEIRSANCPGREWGPGWWISANMWSVEYKFNISVKLIAAFD